MDEWIEILLFVAFVVGSILIDRQKKKSDSADADGETVMPDTAMPDTTIPEEVMPHATPEVVRPVAAVRRQPVRTERKSADNTRRTTPAQPIVAATEEEQSEFALNDIDDVRRAVIWSEILRRKY